jgi:SulP family sulfate permease
MKPAAELEEKALPRAPLEVSADVAAKARAVIGERPHAHDDVLVTGRTTWLANIRRPGTAARSAFVHGMANVAGRVVLGSHVHIAAGSSVRADEGTPFYIGSNTNIQDGVVIHALKDKHVIVDGEQWAVWVGRNVSIAHDALVHGPCYVGDDTFIGFKAVVHDAVVGKGCFLGIASVVVGVEVPDGRFVPPGTIVDSKEKANALPPVEEAHKHFNEDVVEVNRGLAAAYREHAGRVGSPLALLIDRDMHESWDPPEPSTDRF